MIDLHMHSRYSEDGEFAPAELVRLEKTRALGFDGVEAFSSYHSPEQAVAFYRQARARGLFVSCGSDYHGKTKPAVALGGYGALPPDFALAAL